MRAAWGGAAALAAAIVGAGWLGTGTVGAQAAALAGQVGAADGTPGDAAAQAAAEAAIAATAPPPAGMEPGFGALYNLGHAWQIKGDVPRAVGAWRAAAEAAPRSADVAHNLALARIAAPDALPPVPPAATWMALVTPGEVGVAAALACAVTSWLAVRARRGQADGRSALAAGAAAVALMALAWSGRALTLDRPVGVVTAAAGARIGPDFEEAVRHELTAGSEVRVHAARGGFVLVEDGKGRRGWVVADAVWVPGR